MIKNKIILLFVLGLLSPQFIYAKKIYCKKFSGKYKDWTLVIFFNKKGKMIFKADTLRRGWTSQPGNYTFKRKILKVFIHSKQRIFTLKDKNYLVGTPNSFDIDNNYKTQIKLKRDLDYKCK